MNKVIIVGIIIVIIIGIGITVTLSSNNDEQDLEIDEIPEAPKTGQNITVELSESIGLKTP